MSTYPQPGTHAAAALEHIRLNPGCSQNSVTRATGANVAKVVEVVGRLQRHGLVRVVTDQRGYHSIWPAA